MVRRSHPLLQHTTTTTTIAAAATATAVVDDDNGSNHKQQQQQRDNNKGRQSSVTAILLASFLNLLGFTMAGPMTPALGKHFSLQVGASFGSLTSAYPLGMLLGLTLWPFLSDKLGRKKIMTASLVGSGVGLACQAAAIHYEASLACFLTIRALTGTFAGSSPVSKAYLADVGYKDGRLPQYLAWRDAASTMAFIVGPMLGGILYDVIRWQQQQRRRQLGAAAAAAAAVGATQKAAVAVANHVDLLTTTGSLAFVIGVSAAASLAAAMLVGIMVEDFKPRKQKKSGTDNSDEPPQEEEEYEEEILVACPLGTRMWMGVASVCVISGLFNIGDSTFHAFFAALLRDGAGIATKDIGLLYTALACISFLVSTGGTSRFMTKFGPVATCALGMGCVGSGLMALGLAASSHIPMIQPSLAVLAMAAAIYYCGVPLYGPTIPTMLLRCVPSHRRGAIMGLDGTINTIGRIISPLIIGDIYRRFGPGIAFGSAGLAVFGGGAIALIRRYLVLRDLYKINKKGSILHEE